MNMTPIHRDDLPMDVAEEVTRKLQELYPGFKVQFAGDTRGELPEAVELATEQLENHLAKTLAAGQCGDCGAQMKNWPPPEDENELANWKIDDGWCWFSDIATGNPISWICPQCDAEDSRGEPTPVVIPPVA